MSECLHSDEPERSPNESADPNNRGQGGHEGNVNSSQRKKTPVLVIVLGCIAAIVIFIGLLSPTAYQVPIPSARMHSTNNLKQMRNAIDNYLDSHGQLPPAAIADKNGKPLLSWRVAILPYDEFSEQPELYKQFRLDEPWDSPNNIKLPPLMPKIYAPVRPDSESRESKTRYRMFCGKGTAAGMSFKDILDGPANTILIVEAAEAVPWTKPEELEYSPTAPLPRLAGAWSSRSDFLVCMADGSVHMIKKDVSERDLRAAIIIDDGLIPGPEFFGNPK